jgi:aspartate/methionine/tyrosine aminotransferase
VAGWLGARGVAADPGRILLAASTSEVYGWLLALLADPGDEWLVPAPAYPLLELLAGLHGVRLVRYPLRWDGEWHVDLPAARASAGPRARALLVVSPANPTGWCLSREELAALARLCAERGMALVGDEVFLDTAPPSAPSVLEGDGCLAVHLAGLSKTCGLPQVKAAWLALSGPEPAVAEARSRLLTLADLALSVSAAAQLALPGLLDRRETFLGPLRRRLAENRETLRRALAGTAASLQAGPGGWSAVVRVGQRIDEEALCLALLEEDGVVVQPGFFFDFERSGYLVLSLLARPAEFAEGALRLAARVGPGPSGHPRDPRL